MRALQIGGAAVVVLVGVWAGMRVYGGRAANSVAMTAGARSLPVVRTAAGEASPPSDGDYLPVATAIPEHLPDFSLSDREGKARSIDTWSGKSLVLNFWATWCAPCRREIPLLQALDGAWRSRDVAVVGIAVDHRDKVVAYANSLKIAYPLLIGEQDALDVAAQFGVESPVFPFTVFTDRKGRVVTLYVGELHAAQANLILSVVQELNADQVALPDAQRAIAAGLSTL